MKKKLFILGLVFVMVLSLLVGCADSAASNNNASEDPDTSVETPATDAAETEDAANETAAAGSVYWLNFKPEADEALQKIAATYTEQTGVPVKVVTAASGSYEQTLTSEMDKSAAPTLFVVGNSAAVNTWGSYCYDLKGTDVYNELSTDAFTLYDADGKACSIGYCYETFGIIVNKALLAEAGYSVEDITNFDSLKAVAEDIHARAAELGFDAFVSSGLDANFSWRISGHTANMPLYYQSRDVGGWDEAPATITNDYLDNFQQLFDLYVNNCAYAPTTLATGGYDPAAEFGQGEAVFYQNGSWEYDGLVNNYGMSRDDLQMIPIYCGVEGEEEAGLCSGTENCWAVNANASADDIQATLDFMYWMVTSTEGTQCMAEQFGGIPYKQAAETDNVFFEDANALMLEGKYTVEWAFNYTPNVDDWRATVVQALIQYCAGGSWETVEQAFVAGWATQYQAVNG